MISNLKYCIKFFGRHTKLYVALNEPNLIKKYHLFLKNADALPKDLSTRRCRMLIFISSITGAQFRVRSRGKKYMISCKSLDDCTEIKPQNAEFYKIKNTSKKFSIQSAPCVKYKAMIKDIGEKIRQFVKDSTDGSDLFDIAIEVVISLMYLMFVYELIAHG